MALDRKNLPQAPGGQAQTSPGGTRTQQGSLPAAPKPQSGPIVPPPQQPGPGMPAVRTTTASGAANDNPAGKIPPVSTQPVIPQFPPQAPPPTLPQAPMQMAASSSALSLPETGGVNTATAPTGLPPTAAAPGGYETRFSWAANPAAKAATTTPTTTQPGVPPVEAKGGYVKGANGQIDWAATMANWDKQRNDYQAALAGGASIPEAAAQVGAATSAYSGPNASAYQALNNRINAAGLGGFGEGQNALPTAIGQIFNVVMKNGGSAQDAADIVFNYLQSGGGNAPGHLTGNNAFELFARTHDGGQALLTQIAKNPAAFGLGTGKIVNPTGDTNFYGYNPDGSKMTAAQGKAAAQAKRDAWLMSIGQSPAPNLGTGSNIRPDGSSDGGWSYANGKWVWNDGQRGKNEPEEAFFQRMMAAKRASIPKGFDIYGNPLQGSPGDTTSGSGNNPHTEYTPADGPGHYEMKNGKKIYVLDKPPTGSGPGKWGKKDGKWVWVPA